MARPLRSVAAEALRPDRVMPPSTWADTYRVLSTEAARRGRWETDAAPYMREPVDRLGRHDPCQLLVLMFCSQSGKSEGINNAIGCHVHTSPRPMMLVQPTIDTAEQYALQRLEPMFEATPPLARRVPPLKRRAQGQRLQLRRFPGGFLKISGANSAASLASTPIGDLYMDEIDRMDDDVDGEGDPVQLAYARTTTFSDRKVCLTSTPTIYGESRIETAFLAGDRRYYHVPCPHCGTVQRLHWRTEAGYRVRWPAGRPADAVYLCEAGCEIREHSKPWMLARGEWRAEAPENDQGGKVRSYHLSALYLPWFGWAELAAQWEAVQGDPHQLKGFINTRLAETWKDEGALAVTGDRLLDRREPYTVVPAPVAVLLLGVDVQGDRLEAGLWGFGAGEEMWSVDHAVIKGDPDLPETWALLTDYRRRLWRTADGRELPVYATAVDTGGRTTQRVYEYAVEHRRENVWAVKGASGPRSLIWPKAVTKAKLKGRSAKVDLYILGVSEAKELLYRRYSRDDVGPGYVHLPVTHPTRGEVDLEYVRQLTAERRRGVRRGGRRVVEWTLPDGKRNEALDCLVYAYSALLGLLRSGYRLPEQTTPEQRALTPRTAAPSEDPAPRAERTREIVAQATAPATPAAPPPRSGSWVTGGRRPGGSSWVTGGRRR